MTARRLLLAAALALLAVPAPASAARFTTRIDNPYLPMAAGSRWVYRSVDSTDVQRDVVTVTHHTHVVADDVRARVVHDVAREHGRVVEDTYDWYAQDRRGNVWYLGEDTRELERGRVVSTAGSWEAGAGGAHAGIVMPARPRVGMRYVQEDAPGRAQDRARVLSRTEQVGVPFGHFRRALLTEETSPLEPRVLEYKLYARGIGPVLALTVSGGSEREELVSFKRG